MDYDNIRDQFKYGYDRGQILDGIVTYDPERNEYVVVDIDGIAFSPQEFLKTVVGKQVRFTCASFETISNIEQMMQSALARQKPNSP